MFALTELERNLFVGLVFAAPTDLPLADFLTTQNRPIVTLRIGSIKPWYPSQKYLATRPLYRGRFADKQNQFEFAAR